MLVFSNVFILATESESHCKHSLIFHLLAWEREKEALQESRQVSEVAATEFWTYQLSSLSIAWNSSDCFESFSPLNNVWIDRPLMPSSDVTHYPKTG